MIVKALHFTLPGQIDIVSVARNEDGVVIPPALKDGSGSNVISSQSKKRQRIFFLTGEHPRELIAPEIALRFIQLLCGANVDVGEGPGERDRRLDEQGKGRAGETDRRQSSILQEKQFSTETDEDASGPTPKKSSADTEQPKQPTSNGIAEGDAWRTAVGNVDPGLPQKSPQPQQVVRLNEGRPGVGNKKSLAERFRRLLDDAEFQIVLNANPVSRQIVEQVMERMRYIVR